MLNNSTEHSVSHTTIYAVFFLENSVIPRISGREYQSNKVFKQKRL